MLCSHQYLFYLFHQYIISNDPVRIMHTEIHIYRHTHMTYRYTCSLRFKQSFEIVWTSTKTRVSTPGLHGKLLVSFFSKVRWVKKSFTSLFPPQLKTPLYGPLPQHAFFPSLNPEKKIIIYFIGLIKKGNQYPSCSNYKERLRNWRKVLGQNHIQKISQIRIKVIWW